MRAALALAQVDRVSVRCSSRPSTKMMRRLKGKAQSPWGQSIEPTSKPVENTDFTLAHSMNLRRRWEAWTRIDAAATQPVFRVLCHQVIRIPGRVIKRPCVRRSLAPANTSIGVGAGGHSPLSQKTVAPDFFGHAAIRRFSETSPRGAAMGGYGNGAGAPPATDRPEAQCLVCARSTNTP